MAQSEANRRALIEEGLVNVERAFSGFTPAFFQNQQGKFLADALPQVGRQFRGAQGQVVTNLANRGLLKSSAASTLGSSLQQQLAQAQRDVGNRALQSVQGLQTDVAGEKSRIIGQLQASADPTAARTQALGAATRFSSPSLIAPVGNLFEGWINQWVTAQHTGEARKTREAADTARWNAQPLPGPYQVQ